MILERQPHNNIFFARLLVFFKEILDICNDLDISPILVGSVAVLAYTKDPAVDVNDVDIAIPEAEYARIAKILEEKCIEYKIRNHHVLQAKRGDLRVELDSIEYWFRSIPLDCDTVRIGEHRVQILGLPSLTKFYAQAMKDRLKKSADPKERAKYEALKTKHTLLTSL